MCMYGVCVCASSVHVRVHEREREKVCVCVFMCVYASARVCTLIFAVYSYIHIYMSCISIFNSLCTHIPINMNMCVFLRVCIYLDMCMSIPRVCESNTLKTCVCLHPHLCSAVVQRRPGKLGSPNTLSGVQHMVAMGRLRLVGSLKLQVSFAEEPYKRDDILQKRPIISRSLLIVATPYSTERSAYTF